MISSAKLARHLFQKRTVPVARRDAKIRIPPPPPNRRRRRRRRGAGPYLAAGAATFAAALLLLGRDRLWTAAAATPAIVVAAPDIADPIRAPDDPLSDVDLIEAKIGKGETVAASLRARGLDKRRIDQIVDALRHEFDFRASRPGDSYTLKLARKTGHILSFEYRRGPLDTYVVTRDDAGGLSSFKKEAAPSAEISGVGLVVGASLTSSLEALGESGDLGSYLGEVLAWDVDLYAAAPGDRVKLLVERRGEEPRYGRIVAAEYSGAAGKVTALWYLDPEGRGEYVDERGHYLRRPLLRSPLKFMPLEGDRPRSTPVKGGLEFLAPAGTPVVAISDGVVVSAGERGPDGLAVTLEHPDGSRSTYAHLSRVVPGLKPKVLVNQRRVVGYVGQTGRATTPKLGFRVERGGRALDIADLSSSRGGSVPSRHRAHFEAFAKDQLAALAAVAIHEREGAIPPATPSDAQASPAR
jgi:murein DD-endopeptidase MepM/ murein hydrolase activator NlpD